MIIIKSIDIRTVYSIIRDSSLVFWPIIFIALFIDRLLMAYKWNLLLKEKAIYLPFRSILKIYFIGNFVGFFLPATIGSDLSRLYSLSRSGEPLVESFSSIVIERLIGFFTLITVGIISLFTSVFYYNIQIDKIFVMTLLISFIVIFLFLIVLIKTDLMSRFFLAIGHYCNSKVRDKLCTLYLSLKDIDQIFKVFPKVFFWSLLEHMLVIIISYTLALCLRIEISILYFFIFLPAMMLIERIPLAFNGVGVREVLYVLFFTRLGLPPAQGFAISITSQMLGLVSIIPGLYLIFFGKKDYSKK